VKAFASIFFGLILAATASDKPAASAPKSALPAPARSVFTQPASNRDGRDPFFPESTRAIENAQPVAGPHTVELSNLTIKGYSIVRGRPMVIINNHSFMVGDEGDVLVVGGRAHIRCVEIRSDTVVVEANGSRHEIHY
jgi:hypothetical protein